MQCRDFREVVDSYLCDELSVETNHEVLAHLEICADCRYELAARRELRATLRAAATKSAESQLDPDFAARLRARLRATVLPEEVTASNAGQRRWLALAACLFVAFGIIAVRQRSQAPSAQRVASQKVNSTNANLHPAQPQSRPTGASATINIGMEELTTLSVGDHRNCAVKFNLPEKPLGLEEAARKYDPAYIDLAQTVKARVAESPASVEFIEAHWCVFHGRRFAHLELKQHGRLVSLLVTDLDTAETTAPRAMQAGKKGEAQVIACSQIESYQVSCFETARHAVFVVSDLSEADNLNLARAFAPAVYHHLLRAEGVA